jgi:hypothetical protein
MRTFWNHIVQKIRSFGSNPSSSDAVASDNDVQEDSSGLPNPSTFFQDTLVMNSHKYSHLEEHVNSIFTKCETIGSRFKKQGEVDGPFHMRYSEVEIISKTSAQKVSADMESLFLEEIKQPKELIDYKKYEEFIKSNDFINKVSQFLFACYLYGYECSFDKYNAELAA